MDAAAGRTFHYRAVGKRREPRRQNRGRRKNRPRLGYAGVVQGHWCNYEHPKANPVFRPRQAAAPLQRYQRAGGCGRDSQRRLAAGRGKLQCRRDFPFDVTWNEKYYATKQVRPIFVEEPNEIVVVTVYVYYF